MKKNIKKSLVLCLLIGAIALFSNCKKTYSCSCEVKITEAGSTVAESETKASISSKMTEAQAESTCDQTEKQLKESYDEALEDPSLTVKATCEVD